MLVNGRRIRQSVPLRDKDRIEIGSHILVFHLAPIVPAGKNDPDPSRTARVETDVEICDKLVWMLIADLEGSTPLSQRLPGDLFAGLVGRWLASCRKIIEGNGGTINKHLGDGFLAYWPSTQIKPAKVGQTLAALKAMPMEDNCSFRIILHYAKVTVDKAAAQSEDTLLGQEVVFIFRAEKIAAKLKEHCMISLAAAKELMPYGSVTSLGCHPVQGFPGECEFFRF